MQKFKTIREAMTMSPYAIGMAQAKKMYGYGKGPATDLPKKVIKKAHEIAKRVKANESFEDLVDEAVELPVKQDTEKGVTYKGMGTDVVNKKKKLNPTKPLTMKDRQVKDYMEEVEDLDELSKSTLGSYVKKAHRQAVDLQRKQTNYERIANDDDEDPRAQKVYAHMANKADVKRATRTIGLQKAVSKLTKEDLEQVDELSRNTMSSYVSKASDAREYKGMPTSKVDKRYSGVAQASKKLDKMNQAASKMTKEEVEGLDEISKKTLHSYVNKAAFDAASNAHQVAQAGSSIPKIQKPLDKLNKRLRGIDVAAGKMAKEDFEIEEAKEEMPTGIKIYHKNKDSGKENWAIQFSAKNAAAHEKELKQAGHKVTGRSLMFGTKTGPRKNVAEDVEEVNELKKATYANYVNTAARRLRASSKISQDFQRDAERDAGRAYKPGIEPEDKERHLKNYEVNKGLAADFSKSSQNRIAGIERATKKLSK